VTMAYNILRGRFGRVALLDTALLDVDVSLVGHAHPHCHLIFKIAGSDECRSWSRVAGDAVGPASDRNPAVLPQGRRVVGERAAGTQEAHAHSPHPREDREPTEGLPAQGKPEDRQPRARRRWRRQHVETGQDLHGKGCSRCLMAGFRQMLSHKAMTRGGVRLDVNEAYTSQVCGVLPKGRLNGVADLGTRGWACDACAAVHHRDVNAARNVLRFRLETLAGGAHV
jgi:Putative transposase DNA-binding domain